MWRRDAQPAGASPTLAPGRQDLQGAVFSLDASTGRRGTHFSRAINHHTQADQSGAQPLHLRPGKVHGSAHRTLRPDPPRCRGPVDRAQVSRGGRHDRRTRDAASAPGRVRYDVPVQDLSISLRRLPAKPASGVTLANVRRGRVSRSAPRGVGCAGLGTTRVPGPGTDRSAVLARRGEDAAHVGHDKRKG